LEVKVEVREEAVEDVHVGGREREREGAGVGLEDEGMERNSGGGSWFGHQGRHM
jgi:hypothetical protein